VLWLCLPRIRDGFFPLHPAEYDPIPDYDVTMLGYSGQDMEQHLLCPHLRETLNERRMESVLHVDNFDTRELGNAEPTKAEEAAIVACSKTASDGYIRSARGRHSQRTPAEASRCSTSAPP
jgi:hypothetical protein